jgi:DNA repair protein RecO (recombination protein O)
VRALVWTRRDFRETSRLVTLVTREEGRLTTLAKGAHRHNSAFLGRIDFLNLVEVKLSGRPGTLRLLSRIRLLHEPRRLREPARFLAASYLSEIFDVALPEGRADPALFDLLAGAVLLLERCAQPSLPTFVAGIELRFLEVLGLLPDLTACNACSGRDDRLYLAGGGAGFVCARHATGAEPAVAVPARHWLVQLARARARDWTTVTDPAAQAAGLRVLHAWISAAIERRPRLRGLALRG